MQGFILLHRQITDSAIFDNPDLLKFWVWCLCSAAHKKTNTLLGLQEVSLEKGQFIFGRKSASKKLKMDESKIYRYLKKIESMNMIEIKSNNKFSVITIVNWEKFQIKKSISEQQMNNKNNENRTTNEQQNEQQMNSKQTETEQQTQRYDHCKLAQILDSKSNQRTTNEQLINSNRTTNEQLNEQQMNSSSNTNNNINNINNILSSEQVSDGEKKFVKSKTRKKPYYEHDTVYYKAAKWLADSIEKRVMGYKPHTENQLQDWSNAARLMIENDKRDLDLSNKLLVFSQNDSFWQENILSMPKFRKQFDHLLVKYKAQEKSQSKNKTNTECYSGYKDLRDYIDE